MKYLHKLLLIFFYTPVIIFVLLLSSILNFIVNIADAIRETAITVAYNAEDAIKMICDEWKRL